MGIVRSRPLLSTSNEDDENPILDMGSGILVYNQNVNLPFYNQSFNVNLLVSQINSCKANLLDKYGRRVNSGKLEITSTDLVYNFKYGGAFNKIRWPLVGLRWYGYNKKDFAFEAGRRCNLVGVFVFKCKQAYILNALLSKQVRCLMNQSFGQKQLDNECSCNQSSHTLNPLLARVFHCRVFRHIRALFRGRELMRQIEPMELGQSFMESSPLITPEMKFQNSSTSFVNSNVRPAHERSNSIVSSHGQSPTQNLDLTWREIDLLESAQQINNSHDNSSDFRTNLMNAGASQIPASCCREYIYLNGYPSITHESNSQGFGVYLFAVPSPAVSHCYVNQTALIGSH